jgi:hypothetical protein
LSQITSRLPSRGQWNDAPGLFVMTVDADEENVCY